jgi:hypothetical protein
LFFLYSRRVIRKLRHLGYLEAGSTDAVATGYDPLRSEAPELACTLAASVTQRIAFGERAGQPVRRIGSGFGYEGEPPHLRVLAVPVSMGFRCTPTRRYQRIAETSWNA